MRAYALFELSEVNEGRVEDDSRELFGHLKLVVDGHVSSQHGAREALATSRSKDASASRAARARGKKMRKVTCCWKDGAAVGAPSRCRVAKRERRGLRRRRLLGRPSEQIFFVILHIHNHTKGKQTDN